MKATVVQEDNAIAVWIDDVPAALIAFAFDRAEIIGRVSARTDGAIVARAHGEHSIDRIVYILERAGVEVTRK